MEFVFAGLVFLAVFGAVSCLVTARADDSGDRDLMVYALKAGYGRKGARIGSRPGEAELLGSDMLAFWQRVLLP